VVKPYHTLPLRKKKRENIEFELESKLTILYQNGGTHEEEIFKLESELKNIREEKVKGIITRANAKWSIEGERSTRYFCNLEKRHYTEKIIPKLILEDNPEVTHQKDILVHQQLFYQTLYECTGTIFTDEHLKCFFDDSNPYISKLGQDQKLDLEGELTPQEILSALKLMQNGKSPGFTTEFYKFF
jgi:hypothetical protein